MSSKKATAATKPANSKATAAAKPAILTSPPAVQDGKSSPPAAAQSSPTASKPTATAVAKPRPSLAAVVKAATRKHDPNESAPRVLIERRELQSLHAEKSRLFSRIDEENALSRQLQSDVREREELLAAVRVELAQVREVAARQEQLRCEERDRATAEAAAAKERANAANEARAAAEAEMRSIREQSKVAEAEARRSSEALIRATEMLHSSQNEARRLEASSLAMQRELRDELARERERAAAAEARQREMESEREAAQRERAALSERLAATASEAKGLVESVKRSEELHRHVAEERDRTRLRAEAADARAAEMAKARSLAQETVALLQVRVAALEAEGVAALEAARYAAERLRSETGELRTRCEYAELQAKELEQQRRATAERFELERAERLRMELLMRRSEEKLLEEQVRAAVAEERWQPLVRLTRTTHDGS